MNRDPLDDERVEQPPALIATGVMTRTREQARHEVHQREASLRPTAARRKPGHEGPSPRNNKTRASDVATAASEAESDTAFAMSPRFATDDVIRELRQRPAIDFVVQSAAKEDGVPTPLPVRPQPSVVDVTATPARDKRQTWFSPVHVPLAHRKLVASPRIFDGIAPTKPPRVRATGDYKNQSATPPRLVPRVAMLQTGSNGGGTGRGRRRTVDRQFIDALKARNQELYDKLVHRFSLSKRIEDARHASTPSGQDIPGEDDALSGVTSVEDAVLFFLHEKHAHDVLYFKRRTDARASDHARAVNEMPVSMSFSASARVDDTARYMPYDLERIAAPPDHGPSDFFIMSSSALVHHASRSANDVVGEVIPIAQWVMESKMFSLLLAGIPLFQKFLLRKVFVWWAMEARKLIFVDLKKRIARTLPLARRSFVRPLLASFETLRRVQQVQALTLPVKHMTAVQLAALHEHHRVKLSEAETKLIDAKEELLQLMDSMVHDIQLSTAPSTQLDELYSTEVGEIHTVNPKWKSAPIKALRRHRESLTSQVETARMDLSLLAKYVRLMEYMFTESVYLMLLGCIRHLAIELRSDDNSGAISASVAIMGDDLVLSPSAVETKNVLLEGIARLIRLAGNFHFTKNAIAWSTNRGSGSLSLVSSAFSSDAISSQFDLQEVLRRDNEFRVVSSNLIEEVSSCFDEAAHQMKAFESLKPIYAAVQSVSRAETQRNLQISRTNVPVDSAVELQSVVGVSGGELGRYLRTLSHRLSVLDRSQHACQKIQSSWKVGFLEIQCRRSVTEILELITQERELLHKHVFVLATQGINDCLTAIQKASLIYEDRPQLIEYFCEQLKQVKSIKDREKQLHQDIRNVDEIVRALKRYAPDLMTDGSVQYSLLHAMYTRYGVLSQSHDKFVSKMLPNITQQVSNALQRYTVRCQRLLRVYEENTGIATEEELERNIGMFQDIYREIRSIEDATRLYHDYQKMVGMKVMEITMLGEAREHWDEVQDIVTFTIQWKAATKLMESGIFSEQPWRIHLDKVCTFSSRIESIQENRSRSFAARLLDRLRVAISDYQRRLELVIEMAQPYVKPHHWQQIMALLDIVNYVSASGVVLSDGSTLTLGFLQSRSLWKYEGHIRDITIKARNDSVTESKMEDMKRRLYSAILPIVKVDDVYELEAGGATRLLTQFENDLVTVQTLAQLTSSAQLSMSLAQWAEEIGTYQDILDSWVAVQADWKRLVLIFGHHDVQQIVVDATYEFQALDRKWRAMMTAAKGSSSLAVCLREVMSKAFLATCAATSEKLWKELGNYLSEKRHFFPRLYFVSDRDLLHIIASSKHPTRLSRLISKCFQEIHSLRISRADIPHRQRGRSTVVPEGDLVGVVPGGSEGQGHNYFDGDIAIPLFEIVGVVGASSDEEINIKALRVSSSPEIWMRDLSNRIQEAIKETVCVTMDGPLATLYEGNFADLLKPRNDSKSHSPIRHSASTLGISSSSWQSSPLHVTVLCINVLLTSELAPLVCANRSGSEWSTFWDNYRAKTEHLTAFIRRHDITRRERIVASNIVVLLMNKDFGIEELYHDQTTQSASSPLSVQHHHDTTAILYNYANGSSFSWTKMMRFYFEPFDKKCVIHQCVKTHDYGNSFIGGYTCPVLTPLSDRVILAMNVAVSLEVGAILFSPSEQCGGKGTLLSELATSIGNEVVSFSFGTTVLLSQFFRLLIGALQSDACWVSIRGLESRADITTIRVMAGEIGRLRDAIRAGQDVLSIDGVSVNVANSKVGIFLCVAPDMRQDTDHQELLLRMSHALMPIACHRPDEARMAYVSLSAGGMKDARALSRKLAALFNRLHKSTVVLCNVPVTVQQLMHVVNRAASKHLRNPWKSEEKCLVMSLWEEIGTNVIPEHRVAVVKIVRSIFTSAEELELSPLGLLATRTVEMHGNMSEKADATEADDELAYDSDEEDKRVDLLRFRDAARQALEKTHQFVSSDLYIRKLVDLYQVVSRNVMTVLVGQSGSGKTTALDALSCVVMGQHAQAIDGVTAPESSDAYASSTIPNNYPKPARLHPSAFEFKDIYGYFRDDKSWCDGFITRFIKHHCENPALIQGTNTAPASSATDAQSGATSPSKVFSMLRGPVSATSHSPWLVLDGPVDLSTLEPLRTIINCNPFDVKKIRLPNGDQLHFKNDMIRVFCEVGDLGEWCPATISRCGVLFFQGDLVTYTVLVKSWVKRHVETNPKYAKLATFMGKTARSIVPMLLDICKRHMKAFSEILVPHLVGNFLQLLTSFIDQMAPDSSSAQTSDPPQAKVVIGYAAMLTLGLCIQGKAQREFHDAVVGAIPEITAEFGHDVFSTKERLIYDINLTFENQRAQLSFFEAPLPALTEAYMSWSRPGARRRSTFRRLSDGVTSRGGLVGLGSSSLFVPTPRLLGYCAWLKSILTAKLSVLVVGESAIGKTRLLDDVLSDLVKSNQFDVNSLQITRLKRGEDVLNAVENNLSRRMRGVYCPAVGKQALVVAIENLNLETEVRLRGGGVTRPCSEMIRQICDAGGSFMKVSKEFVEFRDLVIASSFSLSPYGYPRLKARLLRHFHVMLMDDPTREVLRTVLSTLPEQFLARLPQTTPFQASDIARLCRFPIETFHAVRKNLKPTPRTPHLLLSLNDVLRCLGRLMNVSAKSTESFADLENYTVFSTLQLFRSRMMDAHELSKLQTISIAVARRLGYAASSQSVIEDPYEFIYADYGDKAGTVRITSRAAAALFVAADERFQWYNRAATKDVTQQDEQHMTGLANPNISAAPMGISPLPLMRKASKIVSSSTPTTAHEVEPPSGDASVQSTGSVSVPGDLTVTADARRGSALVSPNTRRQQVEKSTAASPATIQNMLDVLSFLQAGVHHLFFCGAEPSKRRSATMIACGAQAFHFREVTSQLRLTEYAEQLKVPIMEAGLKASHTLIYVDCDSLTPEEFEVIVHVMIHFDLPSHLYSSSDKAKILAQEHHMRTFQQSQLRRPSVSSFFNDLTAVTSTRDGMIALPESRKGAAQDSSQLPTSPPKKSVYRENLRRCLYLVLSFGRSTKMFDLITSYPTLYYQAGVKTFRFFDRDSLEAVFMDTLGAVAPLNETLTRYSVSADTIHDLRSLAVSIHEDAMRELLSSDLQPKPEELGRRFRAARSRFEDFLTNIRSLFQYQKMKLTKLQELVCNGLRLIEQDGDEANAQLAKSADGRVQLLDARRAVLESGQKLKDYEAMDRDARRAFVLDEQRCSALHSEVEHERELIQIELDKTLPDVAKATDALSQINKYHITEMKSFVNPPQLVRLAMQAVCVLLGVPPTWTEALRILADIHFLDRLRNFDKDRIDASLIERVKMYINHPDFSMENMKRASTASTTLCKWVLALVRYFEVMKRVAPTQKKLVQTEQQFREIDEMVRVERQKLVDLELRLNDLRTEHAKNGQREQELQRLYESKTKWKAEVIQFQNVVNQWAVVLRKRAQRVKEQQFKLVGDCAVVAAACTYASAIPHKVRERVVSRWRELALTHLKGRPSRTSGATASISMPHSHSFLKNWFITGGVLREDFKRAVLAMELRGDEALTINMLLMDQMQKISGRYPVLIDPLGRATSWLKQRYSSTPLKPSELTHDPDEHEEQELRSESASGHTTGIQRSRHAAAFSLLHRFNIVLVDACDPKASELIDKRISHKTPLLILIDHVAECDETSFHALLDVAGVASKKGGHTVIFSTPALDSMLSWKPKIWSQLAPIDCSPSASEIEDHILSRFVTHHWANLESDYNSACEEYVTERGREEQVIGGFLECLQSISEERETVSQSYTRPITSSDSSDKSLAVDGGGLQDHEMSRITRCLEEYLSVKSKRKSAKRCVLDLRARRRQYTAIATRAGVFVLAEQQLFRNFPAWESSLRWDTMSLVCHIDDCIRQNIAPLNASVQDGPDAARVQGSMASMVDRITRSFLSQRLSGLPTSLHRAYRFMVAVEVAMSLSTSTDRAFVHQLLTPSRVQQAMEAHINTVSDATPTSHAVTKELTPSQSNPTKDFAAEFVRTVLCSAIRRLTGIPQDVVTAELAVRGECRGIYEKIGDSFVSAITDPHRRKELMQLLARDMLTDPDGWLEFAQSPTIDAIRTTTNEDAVDDGGDDAPEWVKQLGLLERFLLCLSAFRVVTIDMVDTVIAFYLGQEIQHATKNVTEAMRSPAVRGTQPLVLHTNPRSQVCSPLSSVTQCARLVAMREEMISFISLRAENDIHKLRLLREFHASGTWLIISDVASAGQMAFNSLRMALERLHEMVSSATAKTDVVHDFRIWIIDPVALDRLTGDGRVLPDKTFRRLGALCRHVYLEPPDGLRDCYDAFARDEVVRKQETDRQQLLLQQQLRDGNQHVSSQAVPKPVSQRAIASSPARKASSQSTISYSSQLGPDQMWIQVGLWIFHSLFRKQISMGVADGRGFALPSGVPAKPRIAVEEMPLDLVLSQSELERAMRLIQLHQRQRAVASTMAAVSGLGSAPLSSASSAAEWTAMLQLTSVVFTSKLPQPAVAPMMRDLLSACLALPSQQASGARSQWARASEWEQRMMTMRDLVALREVPASSTLLDESPLMPHTLRTRCRVSDCHVALPQAGPSGNYIDSRSARIVELIRSAQSVVRGLMAKMPPKHCLAIGVQRQEHQRRTSVLTAWRKHRPPDRPSPPSTAANVHTHEIRYRAESPLWERAMLDHLLQIELPAMEAHVHHLWGMVEYLSSLKPDNVSARVDALVDELGSTLDALCHRSLPSSWRDVNPAGQRHIRAVLPSLRGIRYPAPLQLDPWIKWLHKAVGFYQTVTNDRRVPEVIPLSALGFSQAFLSSVLHNIALDRGLSPDDLALAARHPTQSQPTIQAASSGEAEVFASFQVSGLTLWNARWSYDTHAVQESVTCAPALADRSPRLESVPTLTVDVIKHTAPAENTHPLLYRCPVFVSAASFVQLESPVAYLLVPALGHASELSACGVAMFLQQDLDDLV